MKANKKCELKNAFQNVHHEVLAWISRNNNKPPEAILFLDYDFYQAFINGCVDGRGGNILLQLERDSNNAVRVSFYGARVERRAAWIYGQGDVDFIIY